jgi:type II secretory pathway pseudopilin PulG
MLSNKQKTKDSEKGFTIIEILVALPIATLIVIILFGTLFTQYTNSIAESARSNLRSSGQTILINLQDELLFTIAYGEEIDSNITDENAPSGGWTYNTTPETLIINEIALDSTRRDDDRNIVRRRINDCETSRVTSNPVAINNVIYFVEDNPNSDYGRLVKRTLVPEYDICSIDSSTDEPCTPTSAQCRGNAKQTSCPESLVGVGNCSQADSVLTENVLDMQITYFAENNIETSLPSAADKVEIILTLGDKVYGRNIEVDVKHTIRKIN